jgi:hypothetical protein
MEDKKMWILNEKNRSSLRYAREENGSRNGVEAGTNAVQQRAMGWMAEAEE